MARDLFAISVLLLAVSTSALNSPTTLMTAGQEIPELPQQLEPTAVQPLVLVVQPADQTQSAQLVQSLQVPAEQPPSQTAIGQATVPQMIAPQVLQESQTAPQQLLMQAQQVPPQVVQSLLASPVVQEQQQISQAQIVQQAVMPQQTVSPEQVAQSSPMGQLQRTPEQLPTQQSAAELEQQLQQKQQLQREQLEKRQELEQRILEQQLQQQQQQQPQSRPASSEPSAQSPPVAVQATVPSAEAAGLAAVPAIAPTVVPILAEAAAPAADTAPQADESVSVTVAQAERALKVPEARLHWSAWSLVQTLSFAMVVKALCMGGNVLVQLSPFPQVKRWEARNDTGEADAAPYVAICFGGWQWCFYGFFAFLMTGRSGFLILVHSNCLGALLGTYYLFTFHKHCQCSINKAMLQKYLSGVSGLVLLQFCGILMLPAERALFLSGLISSFCSFVGALSMLVTVPATIRTKDSRSIPGMLVAANFGSALVWCLCGYMLGDMLVMGPNVVASFSNAACLYLKLAYPSMEACQGSKLPDDIPLHTAAAIKLRRSKCEAILTKSVDNVNEKTPLRGMLHGKALETSKFATFTGEGYSRQTPCEDGTGGTY